MGKARVNIAIQKLTEEVYRQLEPFIAAGYSAFDRRYLTSETA